MTESTGPAPRRTTYRHGDLRSALLEAGLAMAAAGGPTAVVLREATRRAGVSPNAAYRHFAHRDALLEAVCSEAMSALARAIEDEQADLPPTADRVEAARARFRAVGTGYVRFARAEPGLFRTAFSVPANLENASSPARAGRSGLTPLQLLEAALDGLVEAGALAAERRPGAQVLAWSSVHGLATLLIDGPLRAVPDAQADALARRLVTMVDDGL
ncbi:MAG: TetR family transcriptional regulator [Actinotalea sp.]|nr:TetR family transcriptional regulator [Actinotalea sp.]